jgi:head-tail adaptor
VPTAAGTKNQLVQVERLRPIPTRPGERKATEEAWRPVGPPAWANIRAITANETTQEGRVVATVIYSVTVDAHLDVTPRDRLRWGGKKLAIQGIQPLGLRGEELSINCTEEVQ